MSNIYNYSESVNIVLESPQGAPLEDNTKCSPFGLNRRFVPSSMPPLAFDSPTKILKARWDRFRLLSVLRKILYDEGTNKGLEYPANYHRSAKCHLVNVKDSVTVHKSVEHGKAFYSGLAVCGSVWACPVCSAKIQERRRKEVSQGIDWAYQNNKKAIMVTFTFPHSIDDSLKTLLSNQKKAFTLFRKGEQFDNFKNYIGYTGLIRSLELTYGENGWHPHTHEVWFVDQNSDADYIRSFITERWLSSCRKAGISIDKENSFLEHSVDVLDNASNSDYLAKMDDQKNWGIDRELVKGNQKKSLHPFGMLERIYQGETNFISLFLEYLHCIKGKSQLFWSRGLKNKVGIGEKTDDEIAQETEENAVEIASLTLIEWRIITSNYLQSELLDVAEIYGSSGIKSLLDRWRFVTLKPPLLNLGNFVLSV